MNGRFQVDADVQAKASGSRFTQLNCYAEALAVARSAGFDAAKLRMRKAGRSTMSDADYDHAVEVMEKILLDLGFDIRGWISAA